MELIALMLAIPLVGGLLLWALGERDSAPEANAAFSLATFIAAAWLTRGRVAASIDESASWVRRNSLLPTRSWTKSSQRAMRCRIEWNELHAKVRLARCRRKALYPNSARRNASWSAQSSRTFFALKR